MTFGSLFSGIGGLDLGLERAGMTCKWQVEIDDYATRVLEKHWPDVPRWRDIADFIADADFKGESALQLYDVSRGGMPSNARSPQRVDLICGGFPCQPVSVAGRREGMADERWMWDSFREVIRLIRPRYVLAENVPGLLSANAGRAFGTVLRDLAGLGYDAEWQVLPAAAFGAPHLRKRVFIVANATSQRGDSRRPKFTGHQRGAKLVEHCSVGEQWRSVKPTIRRGDDGVRSRVDRLRCLGNAVVPQVAEWIGKRIIEAS